MNKEFIVYFINLASANNSLNLVKPVVQRLRGLIEFAVVR